MTYITVSSGMLNSTIPYPSVFMVHSWVWGSHGQGRPLPEADIHFCVPICTGALMQRLQVCSKISRHLHKRIRSWSKFQYISGQLLKFKEFLDNAQDWTQFTPSLSPAGPAEWNCLPNDLRMITDTNVFKKKLKAYFYKQAFCVA